MATNKKIITEVASALGAAAARVETLKPKRTTAVKHSKAKAAAAGAAGVYQTEAVEAPAMSERDEIELVAYLHAESRGFYGGSPDEDWLRAEQEVRQRRTIR